MKLRKHLPSSVRIMGLFGLASGVALMLGHPIVAGSLSALMNVYALAKGPK
jgi:hypothetical protein